MKNTKSLLAGILTLMIAVSAAGCGDVKEKQEPETTTTTVTTAEAPAVTEEVKSEKEGIMLSIAGQPGGDMTREEFEAGSYHYEFYYNGKVKDKNGNEADLSKDDLKELEKYANKVIKGKTKVTKDNGADLPSYSVCAYDEDGNAYPLKTESDGWIEGTGDLRDIAEKYFPQNEK